MPIAKELSANGVNYHRFSYEIGDANLRPEVAYNLDVLAEIRQKKWVVEISPYLSYFSNYIYLNPSYEYDRLYGNGNQKFYYTQCRVLRFGGELHAHYMLLRWLQTGMIGEYVYAQQLSGDKKGFTLPFSPPASALLSIKAIKNRYRKFENLYAQIDYQIVATQNHIVPPEEVTPGYRRTDVYIGATINAKKQPIVVSIQFRNLFNVKYYNHTSYYRLMKIPEPGRNLILNVSIPIVKPLKKEVL
jgi:iron complex outermembrane receptor protein